MVPDEEPKVESAHSVSSRPPTRTRRGRRGGRGRHGRGPRPPRDRPEAPAEQPAPPEQLADQQTVAETAPIEAKPEPAVPPRGGQASVASVEKAIEQVNQIIESLRETLDDMEAVLETLELAERQKNADEYEIESLRRSLNRLQRHRDSGA